MGLARSYDVAVVGGGPVGSVAAVAFARRGARVVVLEADPRACKRFAGEWIHPTGVRVLDALRMGRLDEAAPRTGYGFVIFPDDRSEPIELPYPEGVALACSHEAIVTGLREVASRVDGVTFVPFARAVSIEGNRVVVDEREHDRRVEITAARIVGTDGRGSLVRRALDLPDNSAPLSYMASCELRSVELPREGFGHIVLGAPGPALIYRIAQDRVRACLDVPVHLGSRSRTPEFLWEAFSPVLPASIVPAFRRAIQEGPILWAVTRFRPRSDFGRGSIALAGDAVGHVHPMTAMGLTLGFLDAQAIAGDGGVEEYARARRAHVPELLSNALYHCFRREDPSATQVRQTMFRVLRESARERERTMQILSGREERTSSFGGAFLRIAAGAISSSAVQAARRGGLRAVPAALSAYGEWMQWPAAGVLPRALGDAFRRRSTATHPISFLTGLIAVDGPKLGDESARGDDARPPNPMTSTAGGAAGSGVGQSAPAKRASRAAPPTAKAMALATDLLIGELEAVARKLGKVPDDVLGTPAMRMMRAITATEMRTGVAARMMIGRRRLANEGIPRLLGAASKNGWSSPGAARPAFATSLAAELLLVLASGTTWGSPTIAGLDEGVAALLARQTDGGGFAAAPWASGSRGAGDMLATAVVCQAFEALLRRRPGAFDARTLPALARAAAWVRRQQAPDGSFGPEELTERIPTTALAMEALTAAEQNPTDPGLRLATRWLLLRQRPDGAFTDSAAAPTDAHARRDTARVVRALLAVRAPHRDAIHSAVGLIADAVVEGRHQEPCVGIAPWEECWEALLALALHDARARALPGPVLPPRANRSPASAGAGEVELDIDFCRERLAEVSRTFSRPIALLPRHLEIAVTLGYLLCRTADTVEDHPAVPAASREPLFAELLLVLHGREEPSALAAKFADVPGDDAELLLARNLPVVMRVLRAQPEATRAHLVRWISEMIRGMALYVQREPGQDGLVALYTVSDLERYCYFVAGTVGHLLTDLFLAEIGEDEGPQIAVTLRANAEGFATGLQLVNILKDVTDDRARRWSYIPRTACAARGMSVSDLSDPSRRAAAHAAVAPLFDLARKNLDDGLRYALAIPPQHTGVRLFCLLPLWMAARTLVVARGNDRMFTPGEPVKISREEVEMLAAVCLAHHMDDDALRAAYAALWEDEGGVRRSAG